MARSIGWGVSSLNWRSAPEAALVALAVGAWLSGCSGDPERPPGVGAACTQHCVGQGGSGGGTSGSGGGAGLDAGAGTLTGDIAIVNDVLTGSMPYQGPARVTAEASGSGFVTVDTDAEGRFELTSVTPLPSWVGVEALGAADLLPTLQPMDVSQVTEQTLLLVRASTVELWVASAQTTTLPLPELAQVLLHVVDADTRAPKVGVTARQTASAELVLYDDGPALSANLESTGVRGHIALVNVTARGYPGMLVPVTLDDGVQVVSVELRVAAGAVTVLDVLM